MFSNNHEMKQILTVTRKETEKFSCVELCIYNPASKNKLENKKLIIFNFIKVNFWEIEKKHIKNASKSINPTRFGEWFVHRIILK